MIDKEGIGNKEMLIIEKKKEVLFENIKYWKRLIRWVINNYHVDRTCSNEKLVEVGTGSGWRTNDYYKEWMRGETPPCGQFDKSNSNCAPCIFSGYNFHCMDKNSLWYQVYYSKTWGDWVENARKLTNTMGKLYKEWRNVDSRKSK